MKELWADLKGTFTSLDYYKEVLKFPFGRTLKLFFFYFTILAFVTTAVITFTAYIPLNTSISQLPTVVKDVYPDNLAISINDGVAKTNVKEPYIIPLSKLEKFFGEDDLDADDSEDAPKNLLVIDTNANIDDFNKYQTIALLTRNHLSFMRDEGRTESMSLEDVDNFKVNAAIVATFIEKASPFLKVIIPMLIVMTFLGILVFYSAFKMLYLLWIGLVIMLLSKLLSRPLEYGKSYQLSMHFALVVITFLSLLTVFGIAINFPFFTTLLYILVGFIVLNHQKTTPAKKK